MGLWNWGFQVGILSSRPFIFHRTSRLENRWTKHSSCSKPLFVEDSFGGLIILPNNYVDMYRSARRAGAEVSKIGHGYRNQFAYRNWIVGELERGELNEWVEENGWMIELNWFELNWIERNCMNEWMNERIKGNRMKWNEISEMNEWTNERMNESMNQRIIFQ
jgi:hypothetical protein